MVQHCQNCQPSRGHLNGKYRFYGLLSQVSQVSKVPQIRQRPHANCASHACPFRCCKQALRIHVFTGGAGSPRHTHGTHTGAHGHTDAAMHGSHRRTSQPSQPTNATPTHPHARRPKPPTAAALIQDKPPCWCPKFRCSDKLAAGKGCAQGDASERRIERSSRAKTRQKALIALYGLRSTSGKRKSEFQDDSSRAQRARAPRTHGLADASKRCIERTSRTRHGKRRSWPCTACARHQESVAPYFSH
jgi:hypothetical protein